MVYPAGLRETWEDGRAFVEAAARQAALAQAREAIEAARKVHISKLAPPMSLCLHGIRKAGVRHAPRCPSPTPLVLFFYFTYIHIFSLMFKIIIFSSKYH